jgi:hypothetical protein
MLTANDCMADCLLASVTLTVNVTFACVIPGVPERVTELLALGSSVRLFGKEPEDKLQLNGATPPVASIIWV